MRKNLVLGVATAVVALAAVSFAGVAVAGKPGGGGSVTGHITIADAVYGGTTTATVNPGGPDTYVYVQCYAPDFGGKYVYAAFFPADASNQATIGPLSSTVWPQGDAACSAQEGYFTKNGFGRWEVLASTTFHVTG